MNVTGCNYGAHDFVRRPFQAHPTLHFHICQACDASYIRDCHPCVVPLDQSKKGSRDV